MDFIVHPEDFELNKLPTNLDVLKSISFEKRKLMKKNKNKKEPKISIIADVVSKKVQRIFRKAGFHTQRKDKVKAEILKVYQYRQKIIKIPLLKRCTRNFLTKKEKYDTYMAKLLNVFLRENVNKQKIIRKSKAENANKQKIIRKSKAEVHDIEAVEFNQSTRTRWHVTKRIPAVLEQSMETIDDDNNDEDYEPNPKPPAVYTKRTDLSEITDAQSRYGSSGRATSAIVNATLRTFKIPIVIDRSKLNRAQKRQYSEDDDISAVFGSGLYYDSRKDMSLIQKRRKVENGKFRFYRELAREDHYSLVSQPEGIFLGYVVPTVGDAIGVSDTISTFLLKKNIFYDLKALGCDSTNLNTGADGGINHFIEVKIQRPLHWFICLLHMNELPLRNLIVKLDGKTTSANKFSGPIGKALENISSNIVEFEKFEESPLLPIIPENIFNKLSNDQKYLYQIVNALITGIFPESLNNLKIGCLNHSRWITTASRICKLYATTKHPSEILKILTSYIVNIYAPMWFKTKMNELAVNGPKNLFFLIEKSNTIKDDYARFIVQKCIQRNSFFAHPENIMLAQLSSAKKCERIDAVKKILKIREGVPHETVRPFKVPEINFQARNWLDMIKWSELNLTEPPYTLNMNEPELMDIINNPLNVPKYKCHTQMVERAVKEVTRVSLKSSDYDKRNSMVKRTLINRAIYPKLNSKKDFFVEPLGAGALPRA